VLALLSDVCESNGMKNATQTIITESADLIQPPKTQGPWTKDQLKEVFIEVRNGKKVTGPIYTQCAKKDQAIISEAIKTFLGRTATFSPCGDRLYVQA
jgi:hypothetical protein